MKLTEVFRSLKYIKRPRVIKESEHVHMFRNVMAIIYTLKKKFQLKANWKNYVKSKGNGYGEESNFTWGFCSVSLSIFGSLTNLIGILLVIYGGLFRQSLFMFFVILVCNVLMCPAGLTFRAVFAFSPISAMDSSNLCRVQGYVMYSIGGTELFNIALLFVNHYFCVVKILCILGLLLPETSV